MKNSDLSLVIKRLLRRETCYKAEAYEFVSAAVSCAAGTEDSTEKKHVTALEVLAGARNLALRQYGPFAAEVLKSWGINAAADIGNIVFLLIEEKALFAGENDSPEDFNVEFELFVPADTGAATKNLQAIKVPKIV